MGGLDVVRDLWKNDRDAVIGFCAAMSVNGVCIYVIYRTARGSRRHKDVEQIP